MDGLPRLYREERVTGGDRLMRHIYDGLPSLHDLAVRTLLPISQGFDGTEASLRNAYMPRLELSSLRPGPEPALILEAGFGTGANLPLMRRDLRPDVDVEIWGMDLSAGMLGQARKRRRDPDLRLLVADAHLVAYRQGAAGRPTSGPRLVRPGPRGEEGVAGKADDVAAVVLDQADEPAEVLVEVVGQPLDAVGSVGGEPLGQRGEPADVAEQDRTDALDEGRRGRRLAFVGDPGPQGGRKVASE